MVTIHDVARLAGVHHTTVSHALSGKRPVAAATRERVLAAVRELGYQPNAAARSLVFRRTRTVGLIAPLDSLVPSLSDDSHYAQFISSIADRLSEHDYRLLCFVARDSDASDVVRLVRSGQVDGMLLLQVRVEDPRVNALRHEGVPFVSIGRPRQTSDIICADADFAAAATIAVHHLAELGHDRIAFLGTCPPGVAMLGLQFHALAGFRRAHRTLGLPLHATYLLTHSADGSVQHALRPLLQREISVTALIASTPIEAIITRHVLAEYGFAVPDDISLVALNDSLLTQLAQPPMTVVRFRPADLTAVAVDLLLGMLNGVEPEQHEHLIPVELVARHSTRRIGPRIQSDLPEQIPEDGNVVANESHAGA